MEDWIKVAKQRAKNLAETFLESARDAARDECVDEQWFIDEVIQNIHTLKRIQD